MSTRNPAKSCVTFLSLRSMSRWRISIAKTAAFIEPMLLLRKENLPEGAEWLCEIKLDGYRALAIKRGRKVQLRSRNDNDLNQRIQAL
jgi:ATP-dependent DNA ligase